MNRLLVSFIIFLCFNNLMAQCWKDVFNANTHTFAIQQDGSLWAWGNNISGELGFYGQNYEIYPIQVGNDNNWKKVTMGFNFSIALKNDGTIWSTGKGGYGESGTGSYFYSKHSFNQIGTETNWVDIEAGNSHVIALKNDGTIWTWGLNADGQLGLGNFNNVNVPTRIGTSSNWTKIGGLSEATIALNNLGEIYSWGFIFNVQNINIPTLISGVNHYKYFYTGWNYIFATEINDNIFCYGSGKVLTPNTTTSQVAIYNLQPFTVDYEWLMFSGGNGHALGIKTDKTLYSWGSNGFGQLGNNSLIYAYNLGQIGINKKWLKVEAGYSSSFAIDDQFNLWAFGGNNDGQLGDSTKINRSSMVQIECPKKKIELIEAQNGFYPNPVIDFLNYKFDGVISLINIYDVLGYNVLTETDISGKLDLSNLKQGLYVVDFTIDSLHLQQKIIKL